MNRLHLTNKRTNLLADPLIALLDDTYLIINVSTTRAANNSARYILE